MLTHCHYAMFAVVLGCQFGVQVVAADTESPDPVQVKRSIVYKSLDSGRKLLADVYLPSGKQQARPTLLMIHGGAWFSGNKAHVSYHANFAASRGYAVVAINYRLAPIFKFPAQLEDCRDALRWIAIHAEEFGFDSSRVAVYGYSAGAHLACLVAASQNEQQSASPFVEAMPTADPSPTELASLVSSDLALRKSDTDATPRVRAVVAGGAPCEFSWIPDEAKTLAYWLGDSRKEKPEVYAAATPLEFVDEGDPPTFLFHGAVDRIVPLQSSQKMSDQLSKVNVASVLHTVPKAGHLGAFLDKVARKKAIAFLDEYLQP